jgi:uncharacterized protein (TIGR02996 family)
MIVADPADDAPRLIYADWLDEQGDADRAEFIRIQIRLENLPKWEPDRFDLEERSLDLLSAHWDDWTAGLPEAARRGQLTFRRGFVGEARMPSERFLDCGDELIRLVPLLRLTLRGLGNRPEELARSPALQCLREFAFDFDREGPDDPDVLDLTPFFREWRPQSLRHLELSDCRPGGCGLQYPLDWPGYQGLESLILDGVDRNDDEVAAFLGLPGWGELRRLEISGHQVGEQSVLAACRHDRIRELDLGVNGTPRAAEAFTANGWKRLDFLSLCDLHTREDELRGMTVAPWFSRLRSLEIVGTPFNASAALSGAPVGVRHLKLVRAPEEGDGLGGLLDSEFVAGLTSLELYDSFPAQTLAGLATAPRLKGLCRLGASPRIDDYAGLSIDQISSVVESPHLARLVQLKLVCAVWGLAEAARFAALSGLSRLRALDLWGCQLSDAGVRALARSPQLDGLWRLRIDATGGGPCLPALLEAPWLGSLCELWLSSNDIDVEQLKELARNPAVSHLRVLRLGSQPISRAGTEALANSPYLGGLLWLNVGNHSADDNIYEPLRERFGGRFVGCF